MDVLNLFTVAGSLLRSSVVALGKDTSFCSQGRQRDPQKGICFLIPSLQAACLAPSCLLLPLLQWEP